MSAADQWKWNGRSVFIVDGSSVSMPDTPENQAVYPQPPNQKPGLGFPLARIAVLLLVAEGVFSEQFRQDRQAIDVASAASLCNRCRIAAHPMLLTSTHGCQAEG